MQAQTAPVFLIGPMGAGKSTVGHRLARRLRFEFVDCDHVIEARTGVDIPRIFDVEGETGFRRREARLLEELTNRCEIVLATGGGAITQASNRRVLGSRGRVVYLRVTLATQLARVRHSGRPLLRTDDPEARLHTLTRERAPLYESVADVVVDTDGGGMDAVVEKIIRALEGLSP